MNFGVEADFGVRMILEPDGGASEARGELASRRDEGGGIADLGDGVDDEAAVDLWIEGDLGDD